MGALLLREDTQPASTASMSAASHWIQCVGAALMLGHHYAAGRNSCVHREMSCRVRFSHPGCRLDWVHCEPDLDGSCRAGFTVRNCYAMPSM